MGKNLIVQRRGKGNPRYRAHSHKFIGNLKYPENRGVFKEGIKGQITDIIHDSSRTAPIAEILLENFDKIRLITSESLHVGQWIELGDKAPVGNGNVLPLGRITEGTSIYNIELMPGDGGKLVRSAGGFASVVSHDKQAGLTYVRLPSKKVTTINSNSRATVGKIGAGGLKDKPMIHAGQKYYLKRARGKLYPTVCGRAMNAVDHPHGGGRHPHVGRSTTISRSSPPGRKAGHVAAKRTGLKKKS